VSVFASDSPAHGESQDEALFKPEGNVWHSASQQLSRFEETGLDAVLIARIGPYVECDLAVLLGWHRAHGEAITRAFDKEGPLDLWMVDPSRFCERDEMLGALRNRSSVAFEVQGYVNRLQGPKDYRQLVADILSLRCQARPLGVETRTGVWMADGAQVARTARIVAPAYIGHGVRIAEECLVTRCSNVERNSQIDFGTAVEDSSILPNTYIGIGLDLAHSVVDGGEVVNLRHDVKLQITDPVVMRRNTRGQSRSLQSEIESNVVALS
jgi:NDP-sugar pyrophosphorylase family protein